MHQDIEPMAVLIVTDETTREQIEEAIGWLSDTLKRMPSHYADRRKATHARIDELLYARERAK